MAEAGSFVGAARRLGRSPAGLTRAVAALEERLGTRLFTRTTRVVTLTDAGRRHLERWSADPARRRDPRVRCGCGARGCGCALVVTASVVRTPARRADRHRAPAGRHRGVDVRLELSDDVVPLVDRASNVGIRIAHLPDLSLKAVRRVGAPRALREPGLHAAHGEPTSPTSRTTRSWRSRRPAADDALDAGARLKRRTVLVAPRLTVNLAEPAIDGGRRRSRHHARAVVHGRPPGAPARCVRCSRRNEPPPIPVHVVHPAAAPAAPHEALPRPRGDTLRRRRFDARLTRVPPARAFRARYQASRRRRKAQLAAVRRSWWPCPSACGWRAPARPLVAGRNAADDLDGEVEIDAGERVVRVERDVVAPTSTTVTTVIRRRARLKRTCRPRARRCPGTAARTSPRCTSSGRAFCRALAGRATFDAHRLALVAAVERVLEARHDVAEAVQVGERLRRPTTSR